MLLRIAARVFARFLPAISSRAAAWSMGSRSSHTSPISLRIVYVSLYAPASVRISTPVNAFSFSWSLLVLSTTPSVSSPISSRISTEVPRRRREIVRRALPTEEGSCTTLFAAATKAVACSRLLPASISALAESCSAVAMPSDETA